MDANILTQNNHRGSPSCLRVVAERKCRRDKRRHGMTLIEIILSLGILTVVITSSIGFLMQNIRMNRQLSMQVVGLQAVNDMIGEIEDLADSAPKDKTFAYTIVDYFNQKIGENIDIGPNRTLLARAEKVPAEGCLLYRFWIMTPGAPMYSESDSRFSPNRRAVGEMRIYLNEALLNGAVLSSYPWTDLSSAPVTIEKGMDLDLNGIKTDNLLNNYADVKQLAISFNVNFYGDDTHKDEIFSYRRDILITRIKDATKGFDPTI